MNKLIKILQSIGIAITTLLIICGFAGLVSLIILPFASILCVGLIMLSNVLGEWVILGFAIGVVVFYLARQIYKNI